MRYTFWMLGLMAGCDQGPVVLDITTTHPLIVHELAAVELPGVVARNKAGEPVALGETLAWSVSPESVAVIEGGTVRPLADGTAELTATAGALTSTFLLEVSLPDELRLTPIASIVTGSSAPLAATVYADGVEIRPAAGVDFALAPVGLAHIMDDMLVADAPGTVTVTARSGDLTTAVLVTIEAPAGVADALEDEGAPLDEVDVRGDL